MVLNTHDTAFFTRSSFDFTTNYFQAFDIPLATNGNTITLRVSDLAGNVTTTNLDVVLDYTGATTPPVLALVWPTNDMQISGDSFYIRGKINDETATLVAQQVDVNDVTNTVTGIVERNGMFWVENLPLTAGNNEWTIIATDAAGNVSSTNLTVAKSTVTVAITSTPTGDALYDPSGTVSGTVSDASYAVTVNGAAAVVESSANGDGSYNWTAENVPNYGQGTVTYDAVATPPSGGSAPPQVSAAVEQEARVLTTTHVAGLTMINSAGFSTVGLVYSAAEGFDANGVWDPTYHGAAQVFTTDYVYGTSQADYEWSNTDQVGTVRRVNNSVASDPVPMSGEDGAIKVIPHQSQDHIITGTTEAPSYYYVHHYYGKGVHHEWTDGDGNTSEVILSARTRETLYTGGKAGVSRKNLFCLTAGGIGKTYPVKYEKPKAYPWFDTREGNVAAASIKIGGEKVGADYRAYKVLPDNTPVDVTVRVEGEKHYSAGATASKYKSYFEVFVRQPWPDLSYQPWALTGDPPPFGWPVVNGFDAGHAWWRLSSDASVDVINFFTSTNCSRWLGVAVGYGPVESFFDWGRFLAEGIVKTGTGALYTDNGSPSVQRKYQIGFSGPGLINGLEHTEFVSSSNSTWDSSLHNCVHEVIITGRKVGVMLPYNDSTPEGFGFNLPPSTP